MGQHGKSQVVFFGDVAKFDWIMRSIRVMVKILKGRDPKPGIPEVEPDTLTLWS
jgi:hypothetical protein